MRYTTKERREVAQLTHAERSWFDLFAQYEKGMLGQISAICASLKRIRIELVVFSCLFGDGAKEEIEPDLGSLFLGKKVDVVQRFVKDLWDLGANIRVSLILDDCEPTRVWGWKKDQHELTEWCHLVVGDRLNQIPRTWAPFLWSEIEKRTEVSYEAVLKEMSGSKYALQVHQHLEHMKRFPNKKLRGDMRAAALRRVAQYALQGVVLEQWRPEIVLLQSETPWRVKDPLYQPLRSAELPIIHLFEERR